MTPQALGPYDLVNQLTRWAAETPWVQWLELGGSLGRDAGDALSDVDAGVGLSIIDVDAVQETVARFAPAAAVLRQRFGSESTHIVVVYRDGRQLSLVVMPAAARRGLPPQAVALVDKSDHLATALDPDSWDPARETRREWTFLACIAASDALKHAARDHLWRALRSLNEARDLYLQLLAAHRHVIFPQFGAVSLENAGNAIPDELSATLVTGLESAAVTAAVRALIVLLEPYIVEHDLDQLVVALRPSLRR